MFYSYYKDVKIVFQNNKVGEQLFREVQEITNLKC